MSDLFSVGAEWLDEIRRGHLSHYVSYTRGNETQPCLATVSKSEFEAQTEMGVVERWESRDFIVSYHEMPWPEPHRGDRITETLNGSSVTYEVMAPRGSPVWHWADAQRTAVRIHAKAIAET